MPGRDIGYLVQVPWMTENNLLDIKDKLKVKGACRGAGEMAQRLRALPALPKVLSSIPSNDMVAHNHL